MLLLRAAGRTRVVCETRPPAEVNACFEGVLAGRVPAAGRRGEEGPGGLLPAPPPRENGRASILRIHGPGFGVRLFPFLNVLPALFAEYRSRRGERWAAAGLRRHPLRA